MKYPPSRKEVRIRGRIRRTRNRRERMRMTRYLIFRGKNGLEITFGKKLNPRTTRLLRSSLPKDIWLKERTSLSQTQC